MEIPNKIQEEILYYCKINNIEDVDKFLIKILTNGFNIAKYGNGPTSVVIAPKEEIEIKVKPKPIKTVKEKIEQQIKPIEEKKKDLYDE